MPVRRIGFRRRGKNKWDIKEIGTKRIPTKGADVPIGHFQSEMLDAKDRRKVGVRLPSTKRLMGPGISRILLR